MDIYTPETPSHSRAVLAGNILLGAFVALVFVQTFTNNLADFDLWWRLATGRLIHESGELPRRDVFSYLPTMEPWVLHGWLTDLLFYTLNRVFNGGEGLQLLRWSLLLGSLYLCWITARLRGGSTLSAVLCLLLTREVFSFGFPVIRAQAFTYFFFAFFIWWLERLRAKGSWSRAWVLSPLLCLWANLHPGFLAGIGVLGLYAAGQWRTPRRALLLLAVATAGAVLSLVNPYGLDFWRQALLVSTTPAVDVTEWLPVWKTLLHGDRRSISLLFVGLLATSVALTLWRRRIDLTAALVLGATAVLAFQHNRHIVFFGISFAIFVPEMMREAMQAFHNSVPVRRYAPSLGALLLGAYFLFCFLPVPKFLGQHLLVQPSRLLYVGPLLQQQVPRGTAYYPVEALLFLQRNGLEGNLATHLAWGGLMVWAAYPKCRIAFDGRNESVFPLETRTLYFDFILARPGWRIFLERFHTDILILRPFEEIAVLMRKEPGWTTLYEDPGSILLVREERAGAASY